MNNETKALIGIIISAVILIAGGIYFISQTSQPASSDLSKVNVQEIDYSRGAKIGSDSAKVKLVEFSDLQCPACRNTESVVREILAAKFDNFQFIYRHFPLPIVAHKDNRKAADFVEYAGTQGKFWEAKTRVFETQPDWTNLPDATNYFIDNLAKELNLNQDEARNAIKNDQFKDKVQTDYDEGIKLGINSTPTFFLNGKKLDSNNISNLKTLIETELKK